MPVPDVFQFNRAIVDATKDLVCAYKPNLAFYEALGPDGLGALKSTLEYVRREAPELVVIGDAKRGDIPSSSAMYAKALFEVWGFDAATVNCYGGGESLEPFLQWRDRGVFVWCRSSNPGAGEFQDLPVSAGAGGASLYQWVARRALARAQPHASARELDLRFVELHYGTDTAEGLRAELDRRDTAHRLGA